VIGTIPALLAATVDNYGDRLAVVDREMRLTYGELADRAREFASALVADGVEPGDRVAIWAPNSLRWIIGALGTFGAGAVLVPINTRFKGIEAGGILARSKARVLVTVTDFLGTNYPDLLESGGVDLPTLQTTVVADGPLPAGTESWDGFLECASAESLAEVDKRSAALTPDDPADILFTSGTTGVPKGVVSTHAATLHVGTDWVAMTTLRADDRYLMVNPYFHMFGLKAGIVACVASGAAMLPEPVFDVDTVLRRVAAEQVTTLPGSPTLFQSILAHPAFPSYDLSSLRVATIGAADIPVELVRRVLDDLSYSVFVSGYGLSEAGTLSGTVPGDSVETIAATVGRPRPDFELRIVDTATGTDVAAGEPGEIVVRGPSVMSHYLDDPEATDAAFADGWLRTGDIGRMNADGNLRIVGRLKDMFIVGGFNAYPAEIENALRRHPDIADVAVIGIPDDRLGEVGMAFVVLQAGSATAADEIIAWSRDQMANYKVPRVVDIVDVLPLNATGKVEKKELRARAAGRDT
jgi:acyl-CoA synthetase (AMP-forming)/AMP-acid ligase II